ncbi:MAG: carboxynorspermidine decarboxylase [Eubacterium sp.]|nr:carboxynorspermidine decarboxylase [Eubacterium sp.]
MKYSELKTPAYIVQEEKLIKNLEILADVEKRAGVKILLAQKAFSMFKTYPLISRYLSGTTASGIYEAKLSYEEFNGRTDNHVFEPAFKVSEMKELCEICSHIYFNSLAQLELHRPVWEPYQKAGKLKVALRINPEFSTQEGHEIYDPCGKGSRLGIRRKNLPDKLPEGVTGLHFHTLCEQGFQPLYNTFKSIEDNFSDILKQVSWLNMGGGHHISKDEYDREGLIKFLKEVKEKWNVDIYLEPGEAIAIDAGTLITTVLDIVDTDDMPTLILDASAACHMPDVLEMPYTPPLFGAIKAGSEEYKDDMKGNDNVNDGVWVRLASRTCLAGDVIGLYKLKAVPQIGDILTFGDMAIYSMVKNNTFNGMALPDIVLEHPSQNKSEAGSVDNDSSDDEDRFELVKRFGYEDFKERLS